MVDEQELKVIIQRELNLGLGADSSKLAQERRQALEAYEGLPSSAPPAQEGRSSVISRSVFETISWTMPSLMRIFGSSDKIMEFIPNTPDHDQDAIAAGEYCNHILFKENLGWQILYTLFLDSLVQKNSYAKVYWDTQKYHKMNTYVGLTKAEYDQIKLDPNIEIVEEHEYPNPDPTGMNSFYQDDPNPGADILYNCKVKVTRTQGRVKIINIPPEEIVISRRTPSLTLSGDNFVCHRVLRRFSDLVEQGFDPEKLREVRGYDNQALNAEHIARFAPDEDLPFLEDRDDEAMTSIFIEESYVRADMNDDSIAELLKVTSAGFGQVILDVEEIDDMPIISLCPIPLSHKHFGLSLADITMDIQNINTVLWRQGLDSLYLATNPRMKVTEAGMSENTWDDLQDSRFGSVVRTNDLNSVEPLTTPFTGQPAFSALELAGDALEQRSGISKHQMGLSSDSLNLNQTAAGISMIQASANARLELIARVFAETGIREMCKKILALVVKYQQEERIVKVTGQWLKFDPRDWDDQMEVEISCGLGTGNRDGILSHLTQVLSIQKEIITMQGGFGGLVQADNVHNLLQKITTNLGFHRDAFFSDPAQSPPPPPQQQDPAAQAAAQKSQAETQAVMAKAQADVQAQQMKVQADMQIAQQRHDLEMKRQDEAAALQMRLEENKANHAMQIELMKENAKIEQAKLAAALPDVEADL